MYTQEIVAQEAELKIQLPPEMVGKELRVTIEEKTSEEVNRDALMQKAEAFFNRVAIPTKDFNFNREQANAR